MQIDTYPHSPEIEAALLGAILINPNAWLEVSDLPAAAFYIERHRFVWQAYQRLAQAGMTLNDLELLSDALNKAGKMDEVGGMAGLMKFIGVGDSLSAPDYARSLAEYHLRRKLILAAGQITQTAYDLSADTLELLTSAIDKVRGAGEGLETDKDESLVDIISRMYDGILDRTQNGASAISRHIPSPWVGINSFLADGFKPGKLYVVAARPGEGKSTWLTNVAFHAAKNGSRVMFYSLEMESLEVAARILAAQTNMSANLLTDGVLNTDEGWSNLLQGIETAGNADLWIRYTPRLTPEKLRAMAHKAKMEHGMEMLVVDYLQLMRGDGKTANRQEEVVMLCVPST